MFITQDPDLRRGRSLAQDLDVREHQIGRRSPHSFVRSCQRQSWPDNSTTASAGRKHPQYGSSFLDHQQRRVAAPNHCQSRNLLQQHCDQMALRPGDIARLLQRLRRSLQSASVMAQTFFDRSRDDLYMIKCACCQIRGLQVLRANKRRCHPAHRNRCLQSRISGFPEVHRATHGFLTTLSRRTRLPVAFLLCSPHLRCQLSAVSGRYLRHQFQL